MTREETGKSRGWDPVFLHSRREALVIFAVWLAALAWAVPFCYLTGYERGVAAPATMLGIPTWAFWGIAAPWILANAFTVWFCFRFMEDDPLEASAAGPEQGS